MKTIPPAGIIEPAWTNRSWTVSYFQLIAPGRDFNCQTIHLSRPFFTISKSRPRQHNLGIRMTTYWDLNNKTVLVTGGATGIGAAMVRAFHRQGARVFFCDVNLRKGTQLARALGQQTI